jgi:hypothetical protein
MDNSCSFFGVLGWQQKDGRATEIEAKGSWLQLVLDILVMEADGS